MPFQSLQLQNFRNLRELFWELAPGLNVIEGENAQGKTNLLEALYVLANGSSFRSSDLNNLILWDHSDALLQAKLEHQDLISVIQLKMSRIIGEGPKINKQLYLNGKIKRSFRDLHEKLRALIFTPDSTTLFRVTPGSRRRYFDLAISKHYPHYGSTLNRYTRVLRQRNLLLERRASPEEREVFDQQWAELSLQLTLARLEYLQELIPLWKNRLAELTRTHGMLSAQWAGPLSELPILNINNLLELLKGIRSQEERRGRTLLGPHREDMEVYFQDKLVRETASQGQHRMLTISLKLAEADLFMEKTGEPPVFLLDDIGSELDEKHLRALLKSLEGLHSQTVLTTAHCGEYAALGAQTSTMKEGKLVG